MVRAFLLAGLFCLSPTFVVLAATPSGCASAGDSGAEADVIFLQDSGSTNTASFCYTVIRSGKAVKRIGPTRFQRSQGSTASADEQENIPVSLAEKLFSDTAEAMPLSSLPLAHCIKSASFGTSRYIWFKGEKSPDLCGRGNEKVTTLRDDFTKIMSATAKPRPVDQSQQ